MSALVAVGRPGVEEIERALDGAFDVAQEAARTTERAYYDTFDALLRADGLTLVHEGGRLGLERRDSHELVASAPLAQAPAAPFLGLGLAPGALRSALVDVVDVRALLPLARVETATATLRVLDAEQKTVARLAVESGWLLTAGRRTALGTRLRLEGVRGYDQELARARDALVDGLALAQEEVPLVDEAVVTAGGIPTGVSSKPDVALDAGLAADAAAVVVLTRLLEIIDANLAGTIADTDAEYLHDYRVAIRRTRSVQRELRGVFRPDELARMRAEFRWLQQASGDSRDLDVYVLGFDELSGLVPEEMRDDLEPVLSVLRGRRMAARRLMVRDLRSERARALRRDWEALLASLVAQPDDDRPDARRPIGELAAERIRKVYRKMVRMGEAIDADSPPEDYHELRKKGKELRYLLELFAAPMFDGDVVKPLIKSLKALQDVLGRHQDREVQTSMVRSLAEEVSALPGGAAALMAMGVLLDRLHVDAADARGEFAEHFADFASAEQRKVVKGTFR
jgi:CHAD domain-containing protein